MPTPPKCRNASRIQVQLTVGQEDVIRASLIYELMGNSMKKTVRFMVQTAVINEAGRQAKAGESTTIPTAMGYQNTVARKLAKTSRLKAVKR